MTADRDTAAVVALAAALAVGCGFALIQPFGALAAAAAIGVVLLVLAAFALKIQIGKIAVHEAIGAGSLRFAVGCALTALTAYNLLFNYVPGTRRLEIAGLVAVSLVGVSVGALMAVRDSRPSGLVSLVCGFLFVAASIGTVVGLHPFGGSTMFRTTYPLLLAAALTLYPELVPLRLAAWLAGALIVGGLGISFAHGFTVVFNESRLTAFTGGLDGVHSSAYVLALSAMVLNELRRRGHARSAVVFPLIGLALIGVAEFKVATAEVMLLAYFALRMIAGARLPWQKVLAVILVVATAAVAYDVRVQQKVNEQYGLRNASANSLSSGRLSAWEGRLNLIDARSVGLLTLGSGIGSDRFAVEIWNGDVVDSHNDFLTIIIEQGILGFAGYLALLGVLAKVAGREARPLFIALVLSSGLDTALFARPMVAPVFWVAVAIAAGASRQSEAAARVPADAAAAIGTA